MKLRTRIFSWITGYNPYKYRFSDGDNKKADEIKEIKAELRSTIKMWEMKQQMIDLRKDISAVSGSTKASPESIFFEKATDILVKKAEEKFLTPGNNQNQNAVAREISDPEFEKLSQEWISRTPKENIEKLKQLDPQKLFENIDCYTQDNFKVILSEDQIKKTMELITNGCKVN